jgi:hypothetical protein
MAPRPKRASTAKGTKKLPSSAFAYPKTRQYPINTLKRARNALSRAAQPGTSGSYSHVLKKVKARYGSKIKTAGKSKPSGASTRKRRKGGRKRSTRRRRKR